MPCACDVNKKQKEREREERKRRMKNEKFNRMITPTPHTTSYVCVCSVDRRGEGAVIIRLCKQIREREANVHRSTSRRRPGKEKRTDGPDGPAHARAGTGKLRKVRQPSLAGVCE